MTHRAPLLLTLIFTECLRVLEKCWAWQKPLAHERHLALWTMQEMTV